MTSIYPYRHRVVEGPSAGTTVVYLDADRRVFYQTDGPVTYKETRSRAGYDDNGLYTTSKLGEDDYDMTPDNLAYFESIPTLAERGVVIGDLP